MDSEAFAVQIEKLGVKLSGTAVLSDIDLDIKSGGIVGLLGPSGSGKTTLIKAVMGMCPFSGKVTIAGRRVPSLEAVSSLGYMAQNDALYGELSAPDNLLFFGGLYGLRGKAAKRRAGELLAFVDLASEKAKPVRLFSGGMKRRLSLAAALMHSPDLLILDEPTVGIDPLLRRRFWEGFEQLRREGHTIFLTTHVMDEAVHCDKIVLLRGGRIIAVGPLEAILSAASAPNLEEAFLYFCEERRKICEAL